MKLCLLQHEPAWWQPVQQCGCSSHSWFETSLGDYFLCLRSLILFPCITRCTNTLVTLLILRLGLTITKVHFPSTDLREKNIAGLDYFSFLPLHLCCGSTSNTTFFFRWESTHCSFPVILVTCLCCSIMPPLPSFCVNIHQVSVSCVRDFGFLSTTNSMMTENECTGIS